MNSETLSRSESIHLSRDVVTVFTKTVLLLLHKLSARFAELTTKVTPIPAMAIRSLDSMCSRILSDLRYRRQQEKGRWARSGDTSYDTDCVRTADPTTASLKPRSP